MTLQLGPAWIGLKIGRWMRGIFCGSGADPFRELAESLAREQLAVVTARREANATWDLLIRALDR